MLTVKRLYFAILIVGLTAVYPQASASQQPLEPDIFKSSEFLTWQRSSQKFYLDASIGMASLIIEQNDKDKAACLERWYLDGNNDALEFILGKMRDFPDYHPRGIIAAVIENKCGSMTFTDQN